MRDHSYFAYAARRQSIPDITIFGDHSECIDLSNAKLRPGIDRFRELYLALKLIVDPESFNITSSRNRLYVWIVIAVAIILVTVLHFLTPTDQIVWHEIYQRLYYLPIIAAALLFGLRGGLAASI